MSSPNVPAARELTDSSLHHVVITHFLEQQRPPTVDEVAAHFGCDAGAARRALRALADNHGIVLQPQSDEVWVAHPFSAAPTTFVVRSGTKSWWGNCAWCSLGVAQLAGGNATIETRLGALGDPVTVRIENGALLDTDYVVHFPIPMRRAWDNVIFTCSVMLLFRDETQVAAWSHARGLPRGDVRPLPQVWRFASEWYGRHAAPDWVKWSSSEAADMFCRHQLTGPIWALSAHSGRF